MEAFDLIVVLDPHATPAHRQLRQLPEVAHCFVIDTSGNVLILLFLEPELPTRERLQRIGLVTNGQCVICNQGLETRDHLFAECKMVATIWSIILHFSCLIRPPLTWVNLLDWAYTAWKGKSLLTTILKLAWCAFNYFIWEETNRRLFRGNSKSQDEILNSIKEIVGAQLTDRNANRLDSTNLTLCNQ
ncbi:uncharacterized protein LOC120131017 [Hibiscus syriacus]|uniref:uncharacterized protein LOC120131017 n=1 Tax=Hibiscus syriacus TaxID=106335 RepID=UPI001924BA8C|nr:uncharacterized protein LOC120131017 [Hibiscus syriacus]